MIYFCADDYGISQACNSRIETCLREGVLNKISVLPNGDIADFKQRLSGAKLSLHINLVEGYPLSAPETVDLLASPQGGFRSSFIGLFLLTFSCKRKRLEAQLYRELREQLLFWKENMGQPVCIDSHQHTHMIPLVFKTLLRVIRDENIQVESLRIPAEPLWPYLCTPALYTAYSIKGLIKQWLLKCLAIVNSRQLRRSRLPYACFMGVLFSGHLTEERIQKLLPRYRKYAQKRGKDIEIALHPGYLEPGERLIDGCRTSFEAFYFSPWRKKEYDTLMNFHDEINMTKEGMERELLH